MRAGKAKAAGGVTRPAATGPAVGGIRLGLIAATRLGGSARRAPKLFASDSC
jgi:hypothetical protein